MNKKQAIKNTSLIIPSILAMRARESIVAAYPCMENSSLSSIVKLALLHAIEDIDDNGKENLPMPRSANLKVS